MYPCEDDQPDILLDGVPYRLETVQEYFLAKHMAAWGGKVECSAMHWEVLGDRIGRRLGQHVW
jgi:hypothetical protein